MTIIYSFCKGYILAYEASNNSRLRAPANRLTLNKVNMQGGDLAQSGPLYAADPGSIPDESNALYSEI